MTHAEYVPLEEAVGRGDILFAPASVRRLATKLAGLLRAQRWHRRTPVLWFWRQGSRGAPSCHSSLVGAEQALEVLVCSRDDLARHVLVLDDQIGVRTGAARAAALRDGDAADARDRILEGLWLHERVCWSAVCARFGFHAVRRPSPNGADLFSCGFE
jgi:hypothetical protein